MHHCHQFTVVVGTQKQGRFEVYEGDAHPPLSPPNQLQPGALMEQHLHRNSSLAAAITARSDALTLSMHRAPYVVSQHYGVVFVAYGAALGP